jgi:hypothetical protein
LKPLHIIAIMDGRLGHKKQTLGIIQALEKRTPVSSSVYPLPPLSTASALKNGCSWLFGLFLPPRDAMKRHADLIIGTGAHTHIPLLLLKNAAGAKAITCMSPMFPLNRLFDLCFVPSHDRPRPAKNIFITMGPPSTAVSEGAHDPGKALILVGGIDDRSHTWHTQKTIEQITTLVQRTPQYHWTISSSPRTPAETVVKLEQMTAATPRTRFFEAKDTPSGWIEEQYAANQIAWVTADSISMIYEALTAGCHVGILPVAWHSPSNKFQNSIDDLTAAGLATSFEGWLSGKKMPYCDAPLNEADRCAVEVLRRWWPERLL